MNSKKSNHVLEATEFNVKPGGVVNIGTTANVEIRTKIFSVAGVVNIAKEVKNSWFWKPFIVAVIAGITVVIFEYSIK